MYAPASEKIIEEIFFQAFFAEDADKTGNGTI